MNMDFDSLNITPSNFKNLAEGYFKNIPACFWRIDIVKNEISFLNNFKFSKEKEKAKKVLQNKELATELILSEDNERFLRAYTQITNLRQTACTFRVRTSDDSICWFKVLAMPDPEKDNCSIGVLVDISSEVDVILETEGRPSLSTKINIIDKPIILFDFASRSVFRMNTPAQKLLDCCDKSQPEITLNSILKDNDESKIFELYENLIFNDHWYGKLNITTLNNISHSCRVRIQAISRDEQNLLWVTLTHQNDCKACIGVPVQGNDTPSSNDTILKMNKSRSIKGLLNVLLKALPAQSTTDGIMLSRINIAENKVTVTGVGSVFKDLNKSKTHPYEGSIAENIVKFDLPNHVVMETSKSIKPIDWALFIPRGIRSYYAQPFYDGNTLAYVLIFCSTKSGNYDPDATPPLFSLHHKFISQVLKYQN